MLFKAHVLNGFYARPPFKLNENTLSVLASNVERLSKQLIESAVKGKETPLKVFRIKHKRAGICCSLRIVVNR